MRQADYDRAIEDFDRAIEMAENCALYFATRSEAYRKLGQEEQALADREKARQVAEDNWGE